MRGYFALGVEGISKAGNMGNLLRSAHSFGASFFFAVAPDVDYKELRHTDTSGGWDHMPYYEYDSISELALPKKCSLVAVELTPDAIELPSFHHPTQAAYILGPEMGSVSAEMLALCDHTIKIPMKFCVNVGVAGALVMYDRLISNSRFAPRPARPGGPSAEDLAVEMKPVIHRRKTRNAPRKAGKKNA